MRVSRDYWKCLTVAALILLFSSNQTLAHQPVFLVQVVHQTMGYYFNSTKPAATDLVKRFPVEKQYNKPAGLFVTLSSNGHTRACWGSLYPEQSDIVKATVYATIAALTKDYRYRPISSSEWQLLKAQVTVIQQLEPISSIHNQNPMKDGLLVRSGSRIWRNLARRSTGCYLSTCPMQIKSRYKTW